jgi:uncharacterized repeat protein (TIGR03803 family)
LYSFQGGQDGTHPYAGLTPNAGGALYGTTGEGGAASQGTVFKFTHSRRGYSEAVLHSFVGGSDGSSPLAGLVCDKKGDVYGTTFSGGEPDNFGTVFEVTRSGNEKVIWAFQPGTDGRAPQASLLINGNSLVGTAYDGGVSGDGVVFRVGLPH